ncbi:hypothetical protein HPP92_020336 [Vanilla planifolia]|uniref:RING-CH-type domain-containing protein n=1 Tax=Vanilla planifolia TaxID=51239 RepID=A0A835UIC3_VANPL|nr:hypothetical protein HPP92_020739 [Vanilla planifolia]KAG0461860.1 hypothetical protein HPP92_020336 [Vanilla planifolia]
MTQNGMGMTVQQVAIEGSVCDDRTSGSYSNSASVAVDPPPLLTVVVSKPDEATDAKDDASRSMAFDGEKSLVVASAKKGFLLRNDSDREQCRVCQQSLEEPLIILGCGCRGELAKAHRSCIEIWFRRRGSNKCEICQQVAVNVPLPESQPTGCFSPLWVAFAILIGGLLLDVLISVSLGVSALPVNIIIGVLIVLGLGTALRLALECCHDWGSRRNALGTEMDITPVYQPPV